MVAENSFQTLSPTNSIVHGVMSQKVVTFMFTAKRYAILIGYWMFF